MSSSAVDADQTHFLLRRYLLKDLDELVDCVRPVALDLSARMAAKIAMNVHFNDCLVGGHCRALEGFFEGDSEPACAGNANVPEVFGIQVQEIL